MIMLMIVTVLSMGVCMAVDMVMLVGVDRVAVAVRMGVDMYVFVI